MGRRGGGWKKEQKESGGEGHGGEEAVAEAFKNEPEGEGEGAPPNDGEALARGVGTEMKGRAETTEETEQTESRSIPSCPGIAPVVSSVERARTGAIEMDPPVLLWSEVCRETASEGDEEEVASEDDGLF